MRIAIVKLSALGDIVHAMIVLQFIKNYNRKILIDWFVDKEFKEVLENNIYIHQIHTVNLKETKKNKSIFKFLSELNQFRKLDAYDIVIDLQGLIKSALISKLIPSDKTIGYDKYSVRELLSSFFYSDKLNIPYSQNVIERNIALICFALEFSISKKQITNKAPFMFSKNKYLDINFSNTKKNIILIPGASHSSKCYPVHKFAELSKLIDANYIAIWGSEKEKLMATKLNELSPKVIVCNKLSIDSLKNLISMSDLVIGPDTGPTHFAWALNVPSIILFGPTPGYRNTYKTSINRFIESDSSVNPMKINKNDFSIQTIEVNKIFLLMKDLLG